jgi:hypothetical protein
MISLMRFAVTLRMAGAVQKTANFKEVYGVSASVIPASGWRLGRRFI